MGHTADTGRPRGPIAPACLRSQCSSKPCRVRFGSRHKGHTKVERFGGGGGAGRKPGLGCPCPSPATRPLGGHKARLRAVAAAAAAAARYSQACASASSKGTSVPQPHWSLVASASLAKARSSQGPPTSSSSSGEGQRGMAARHTGQAERFPVAVQPAHKRCGQPVSNISLETERHTQQRSSSGICMWTILTATAATQCTGPARSMYKALAWPMDRGGDAAEL